MARMLEQTWLYRTGKCRSRKGRKLCKLLKDPYKKLKAAKVRMPIVREEDTSVEGQIEKNMVAWQRENIFKAWRNPNEQWMWEKLVAVRGLCWTRQHRLQYRFFDFYCEAIHIAVEVDGAEHDWGKGSFT